MKRVFNLVYKFIQIWEFDIAESCKMSTLTDAVCINKSKNLRTFMFTFLPMASYNNFKPIMFNIGLSAILRCADFFSLMISP